MHTFLFLTEVTAFSSLLTGSASAGVMFCDTLTKSGVAFVGAFDLIESMNVSLA